MERSIIIDTPLTQENFLFVTYLLLLIFRSVRDALSVALHASGSNYSRQLCKFAQHTLYTLSHE